jgi:curved DNA-binding protein CbpA
MVPEPDAYRVLQVDRQAHPVVVAAAYRALARVCHPDGVDPDPARMAAINWAYAQLRSRELRAAYDRRRVTLRAVGPGHPEPIRHAPPGEAGAFVRAAERSGRPMCPPSSVLEFGRYAGWTIAQLARHDPDYLRWLCRHSAGLRFRSEIQQHLGYEPDLHRRASATS